VKKMPFVQKSLASLVCLCLGFLFLVPISAGSAEGEQAPRNLTETFSLDLRKNDYPPELLLPVGQGEIFRDEKGLLISISEGKEELRQDTGVYSQFSIRGDFEATVSFDVLKADRPKAGPGVGPVLYAARPFGTGAVSVARRILPDGKAVFLADRMQRVRGKLTHDIKSLPSTATAGKLRLTRCGAQVHCYVSEGHKPEFVQVAKIDFGTADIGMISVCGSTGESESGLEVRLLDLSVRAESLPGLADQPSGDPGRRSLDARQAAELETRLQTLYARIAPAVVRILNSRRADGGFSGVIISPDGEVLTCAHHGLAANTKVIVQLSDGRKVGGTILGSVKQTTSAAERFPAADVGMVLLNETGLRHRLVAPAMRRRGTSVSPWANPMSTSAVSRPCCGWVASWRPVRTAGYGPLVEFSPVILGDRFSISMAAYLASTSRWSRYEGGSTGTLPSRVAGSATTAVAVPWWIDRGRSSASISPGGPDADACHTK
jgi:hypothetical protein